MSIDVSQLIPFSFPKHVSAVVQKEVSPMASQAAAAQAAYSSVQTHPSQLGYHNAGVFCERMNATDLAVKSYSSAIRAYQPNSAANDRIFFYSCLALGTIHFRAQHWQEAFMIYGKALKPKFYECLDPKQRCLFLGMQNNFNAAFVNQVNKRRPDLLESKEGIPFEHVNVLSPQVRAVIDQTSKKI